MAASTRAFRSSLIDHRGLEVRMFIMPFVVAVLAMAQAPDAGPDAGPDVDARPDAAPDADAGPDAEPDVDAGPDAGPDAEPDAAPNVDAGPDDDADVAVSADEARAIADALARDTAGNSGPARMPDLSKVNVGAALPAALQQSVNLDIAFILDVAAAWFSVDEPAQLGAHDPNRTGFTLQQLEMSVGASVDPFFRFDSNIVFSLFGVEIEEAYATTLALPGNLQLRAGQFLTRFGRLNNTHPHAWHFVDLPVVNGKMFGAEGSRGLGGEVSWLAPLPWYVEAVLSTTNADGACCARSFLGSDDIGVRTPLDLLYTASLKQFFALHQDLSLFVGVSAQAGPNASGNNNRSEIAGADLVLRYRPVASDDGVPWSVSLEAEALVRGRQVPFGTLHDGGGYTQLVWQIDRQWETAARYELVSGVVDDPLDPEWTTWRQRGAAQLTYYPSHFSRLRLHGSADHLGWLDTPPAFAVMATLEVLVGAHGAHSY
jgi:hypothetical protein